MSWWIYFFNYSRKTHVNSLNLWFYSTVKVVKRFWFLFRATVKNKFASFYISRILITLLSSRARIAADIFFLSCYFITEHFGRKFSSFFFYRQRMDFVMNCPLSRYYRVCIHRRFSLASRMTRKEYTRGRNFIFIAVATMPRLQRRASCPRDVFINNDVFFIPFFTVLLQLPRCFHKFISSKIKKKK